MTFNLSEQQEKKYLQQVIGIINDTIQNTDTSVKEHVETLQEYKDYIWSNKDIDPHEIRSMRESILNHFALGESVIDKRRRLGKILDIPYFGRIDFEEKKNGSSVLPIYIGIHTFYDSQSKTNLIYDWRAPISGMFYDYELGKAVYTSPTGEISGDISLKRQYRIRKGKMEYMIESSLTVHDEILQKELSSNADDKMKNIVSTIQREQNRIIRNEEAHVLIIQGVAGSGKTSTILATIDALRDEFNIAVIEGDIASNVDAERIKAQGIPAVQINTGGACHLESAMLKRAVDVLDLARLDLIIVENVGNLVCPTDFDLGENAKVMILSVPEGDDKPLKYPGVFQVAEAVVLNKVDTLPVFNFDREAFESAVRQLNPQAPIFPIAATKGDGVEAWAEWLADRIREIQ